MSRRIRSQLTLDAGKMRCGPGARRAVAGLLLAGSALALSCGGGASSQPPPAEPPPAPPPAPAPAPREPLPATHAAVTTDAIVVRASHDGQPAAGVSVVATFVSGAAVTATTDAEGVATLWPSVAVLFDNAESAFARVTVGEDAFDVDVRPLVAAARASAPDEWSKRQAAREAAAAKADSSVAFSGGIYHDSGPEDLVETCYPTGAEICNDGIDNDCDGRYDDNGCGYASGALQWTASWYGGADLDLHVEGPDGIDVSAAQRRSEKTGLVLDRACPGAEGVCRGGDVENIHLPPGKAPMTGLYTAYIEVVRATRQNEPIHARISGRIGSRTWYANVSLAPFEGTTYRVAFAVGGDSDGDSVTDEHDACPKVPGCYFEAKEHRGCPDRDKDWVPDAIDKCPTRAGVDEPNDPKSHGCPKVFGQAWITNAGVEIRRNIEFATGKADIEPRSKALLKRIAEAIKALPASVQKLAVEGHTDSVGDDVNNMNLSKSRAEAVRKELAALGIPLERLVPRGYGETRPVADNATPAGRKENRRVEFVVLEPRPKPQECFF